MDKLVSVNEPARVGLALALVVALVGCTGLGKNPESQPAGRKPPSDPVAAPASTLPSLPNPPPPAPPSAQRLPPAEVATALRTAQGQLQDGDAGAAQDLLARVLATDPNNAMAQSYLRQIESDPQSLLGRESHAYVVRPGDSLSSIARDRLRDANLFYALARYNNIKVPRLLAAGQTLRVPGRAPAGSPPPAPVPSPSLTGPTTPAPAPPSTPAPPPEDDKPKRIAALMREGRVQFARQDLCASVRTYDKVLEIDPGYPAARSERQRSLELIDRLRQRGGKLDC